MELETTCMVERIKAEVKQVQASKNLACFVVQQVHSHNKNHKCDIVIKAAK